MKTGKFLGWSVGALVACGAIIGYLVMSHPASWASRDNPGRYLPVEIQHPIRGAIMPRNMPAPAVLWLTNAVGVGRWTARFEAGGRTWAFEGIQPRWRPPETEWRQVKQAAHDQPIQLVIAGYAVEPKGGMLARGSVQFVASGEAVEAPLFYRDVNLPFIEAVKDPSKIRWRFGTLDQGTVPPVVLEKLPVCGNCHSFSRNGEYLAMDVDYANNKGSYAIVKTAPQMLLTTNDIISWDDFRREDGEETLGLLSQISPDGRYVLSTVKDLSIFMPKPDLAFSQLFFPIRGILAVYDREAKRFATLPGADDPAWVQSNPTWSPDGQWIIFARARAVQFKKAPARGRLLLTREEDEEMFRQTREFRFDLCRLPFNGGRGGQAEPLRGASGNGRSNYFPKYSPDGRWIVYCQAANYMLLQPDSEMFIIPSAGGEARRLACNLGRMNSWHSWSPDSRWLVFTSKAHSDYTQLYLSRIQANGEASPPVWLAHMVEPYRVANIPEFVALPANAIVRIQDRFLDDHSYLRAGDEFLRAGETDHALEKYRAALAVNSNNIVVHRLLGKLLKGSTNKLEALEHLQAVARLDPRSPLARFVLGCALASGGDLTNAIVHFEQGILELREGDDRSQEAVDPKHQLPEVLRFKLGLAYEQLGNAAREEEHFREALRLAPDYAEVHYHLGTLLLRTARLPEAEERFLQAAKLMPAFGPAHNCLGIIQQRSGRKAEARASLQKAVQCDTNDWQAHLNLAFAYLAETNRDLAIPELREVLRIQPTCQPARQALAKAQK